MHQETGVHLLCWRTRASSDWWLVEKMSKFCFCITKRSCWLGCLHNQPLRLDSVQARGFPTADIVFTLTGHRGHGPMLSKSAAKKEETWPVSIIWRSKVLLSHSLALVCKKPKTWNAAQSCLISYKMEEIISNCRLKGTFSGSVCSCRWCDLDWTEWQTGGRIVWLDRPLHCEIH